MPVGWVQVFSFLGLKKLNSGRWKKVFAAASSRDGRQETSMEKNYFNTTTKNSFSKEGFGLENFQQGYE